MDNKRKETPETIPDSGLSNKNIRIAILDDDPVVTSVVKEAIDSLFADKNLSCGTYSYHDPVGFLAEDNEYDLLFFDIEMPEIDGIRTAEIYQSKYPDVSIVFVSNAEHRVFESLRIQPFGFIRKSHFMEDVHSALDSFIKKLENGKEETTVLLKSSNNLMRVRLKDIVYIESDRKKQYIHMDGKERTLEIASTMKQLCEELEPEGFISVHKAFLVNYRYIMSIGEDCVYLKDGSSVFMANKKAKEVKTRFMELMQSETDLLF